MGNSTGAGVFVAATLEDAVKAGIAGAGLGTVGAAALNHNPVDVGVGFVGAFIASLVLSLVSQPFGDKSTNHVLNVAIDAGEQLLAEVVRDVAASQQAQEPAVGSVTAAPAYPVTTPIPSPQAPVSVQPGVPAPGA